MIDWHKRHLRKSYDSPYKLTMLYERWRDVAAAQGNELALGDFGSGSRWTFAQLRAAAEKRAVPEGGMACPPGASAEFILDLLAAWQAGKTVCPLEPGQFPPAVPCPPPSCVHLKTTSATTSAPRLVAFTAAQLQADAENIVATMGLRPDWPNLGVISLAHSYGFSNLVLPLLLQGIPLILAPAPLPEIVLRAAAGHAALTLPAVPALWQAWHTTAAIPANVRLAISAGARLPLDLEQSIFQRQGIKLHNFYGSSECGGIAYDATGQPRNDESLAGQPMKNVAVSIGPAGGLCVQSGAVGQTYWPEAEPTLTAGQFQSGDQAEIIAGAIHLRGRLTEQINMAGRKVFPETIEQALRQHPDVKQCLVFGTPSNEAGRGETIVACVVAANPVTPNALKQFLLDHLPAWQVPREWWFVGEMAPSDRGKISRAEWRRRFLQEFRTQ